MKTYGLIGYPLDHSFSASYFAAKFRREQITDAKYILFPLKDVHDFPQLLEEHRPLGLNVTIPHKETILPWLDEVHPAADEIGAVNCIRISYTGDSIHTMGYNTDCIGFKNSLLPLLKPSHTSALVLGNGGAAKAVNYVLRQLGIHVQPVTRTRAEGCLLYEEITPEVLKKFTLIVQTTPLGMHPRLEEFPRIPYEALTAEHLLYDLVYNPAETLFLQKGKAQGAIIKNGLEMLEIQAEESWNVWNEQPYFSQRR